MFHHNVSFEISSTPWDVLGGIVQGVRGPWLNERMMGWGDAPGLYAKTTLLKDREGEEFGIENCQEIAHALNSMQWSAMPGVHPSTCLCTGTYISLFIYAFASMCLRVSRVSMYLEMYAIGMSKGIIMKI